MVCKDFKQRSLRELVETAKKMRQKGYNVHFKGGKGKVRPVYEDKEVKGGNIS